PASPPATRHELGQPLVGGGVARRGRSRPIRQQRQEGGNRPRSARSGSHPRGGRGPEGGEEMMTISRIPAPPSRRRCIGAIVAGLAVSLAFADIARGQQEARLQLPHASCLALAAAKLTDPIVFEKLNNKIPKVTDPEKSADLLERIFDGRHPLPDAARPVCPFDGLDL